MHLLSSPPPKYPDFCALFKKGAVSLLEKQFGFVVDDGHLLAAAVLSFHGLKWLRNAKRQALKFGTRGEVIDKVKGFIEFVVNDLTVPLQHDQQLQKGTNADC